MMNSCTPVSCHIQNYGKPQFPLFLLFAIALVIMGSVPLSAQQSRISKHIASHASAIEKAAVKAPLTLEQHINVQNRSVDQTVSDGSFFRLDQTVVNDILGQRPNFISFTLKSKDSAFELKLMEASVFTGGFEVSAASNPNTAFDYERPVFYWGIVEGNASSLVSLTVTRNEVFGVMQVGNETYNIGRLENDQDGIHILYESDAFIPEKNVGCFVDDSHRIGTAPLDITPNRALLSNCVRMYIEVDHDIYVGKGGIQQATDYIAGAFSQVSLLYFNEDIELVVNQILVWDTTDPYTGGSTSTLLTQFRNNLNGNYNGDLAHLCGYVGSGGIAYLDVLCNSFYGVGYSDVNPTYANVPNYSWTIEVLTHEIGHNLGSPHTHACEWNGNNTALDGCGPAAGYSEGCNAPLPDAGTIMSYCHLVGGVGIDFTIGFGDQPGTLIRNRVTNASCLEECGPPVLDDAGIIAIVDPIAFPCESSVSPVVTLENFGQNTLTTVTIEYQLDNGSTQTYAWSGSLGTGQTTDVTLPQVSYSEGDHTFSANTANPNGVSDENPANDGTSTDFTYITGWCVCNESTTNLSPDPLVANNNPNSASVNLGVGSKHPAFSIQNLGAQTVGNPNNRYEDVVTVTYEDGDGIIRNYGTFSGASQSSVNVDIFGLVNSINVSLVNGQGNNNQVSVNFTVVDYCAPDGGGCPDDDGDGVCNVDDQCDGLDDNLIGTSCDDGDPCTENDVYSSSCLCEGTPIPDCPGGSCPNEITSNFTPSTLTHSGSGSSFVSITFPPDNEDVSFTISDLDAKTNGNPSGRYIDRVVVTYNGNNNFGTFTGDALSSVDIDIPGPVSSVTVTLNDGYDGNPPGTLSVDLSEVTSCINSALVQGGSDQVPTTAMVYPNPTSGELFVKWDQAPKHARVLIYNSLGSLLGVYQMEDVLLGRILLKDYGITGNQLLFLSLEVNDQQFEVKPVLVTE